MLRKAYGNNCIFYAQVFKWYELFKDNREDLNNNKYPDRLKSTKLLSSN